MNKKTVALTQENYDKIILCIKNGFVTEDKIYRRPNLRIATALILEANLGLRISDVLNLHIKDIINDGGRYRLDIIEQKTQKKRTFTVHNEIYNYILNYALDNNIDKRAKLLPISVRTVQKHLAFTCDYLKLESISTHSFRKFFATEIYNSNGYNIELVRTLLQHTSAATTQKYLGIQPKQIEDALSNHIRLL